MDSKYCKRILICTAFLLLCVSVGMINRVPGETQALDSQPFASPNTVFLAEGSWDWPENDIGNTKEQGRFWGNSDYLYGLFFSGEHFFSLGMKDCQTGVSTLLINEKASNIVFYEDYLYFIRTDILTYAAEIYEDEDWLGIYRMNVETKKIEKIVTDAVSCFYIYQNQLLYQLSKSNFDTLIKQCDLDGENCKELLKIEERVSDLFSINSNKVIVPLGDNSLLVYDIVNNGYTNINLQVTCKNINHVIPTEFGIVFLGVEPEKKQSSIYMYDFTSNTTSMLVDGWCRNVTYDDGILYFVKEEGNINYLCSIDLVSHLEKSILCVDEFNYTVDSLNVIGKQAFCTTAHGRGSEIDSSAKLFIVDLVTGKWMREY